MGPAPEEASPEFARALERLRQLAATQQVAEQAAIARTLEHLLNRWQVWIAAHGGRAVDARDC